METLNKNEGLITQIIGPVFTTFMPLFKPSVDDIATVLTRFEPSIC